MTGPGNSIYLRNGHLDRQVVDQVDGQTLSKTLSNLDRKSRGNWRY